MPIDDESGEYIAPAKQYLDNLVVHHPELGQCELWKAIAWDTAKLRNYMARADNASAIDAGAEGVKQPPPLVADAVVEQAKTDIAKRIIDLIGALNRRMDKLEEKASAEDRQAKVDAALKLAEDIAENAPQALLASLADRPNRRLH